MDDMLDFSSLADLKVSPANCTNCGGKGFVDRPCTVCGAVSNEVLTKEVKKIPKKYKKTELLLIPDDYNEEWVEFEARKNSDNSPEFSDVIESMKTIYDDICSGILPSHSYIISAPSGTSKKTWAYSCMRKASELGFTVAPLITTSNYKRLEVLSGERPKYKLFDAIEYDEYINSELLFLSVVKNEYCTEAFAQILTILDIRSSLNKSTIILSSIPSEYLGRRDFTRSFKYMLKKGMTSPSKKIPRLVEYFEDDF